MPENKLALCIITSKKDLPKTKLLAESLRKFVDEVCITVTSKLGKGKGDYNSTYSNFEWIDDFSAARTFNFSQTKAEWILWLDADDTITHPEKLRELIKVAQAKDISGFFFNYQYAFDERGNCTQQHWKLQLVKNDGHFSWKGAIHEDILQDRAVKYVSTDWVQRIHHPEVSEIKEKNERNLRILLKELKKNPEDPRLVFYVGREHLVNGDPQKGIDLLTEYLNMSGWDDERYEAYLLIGMTLLNQGKVDEALLTFNAAILEKEKFPDAYIQKGNCYLHKKQWDNALQNFKISLGLSSDTAVMQNPMNYSRDVWMAISECYLQLGKLKDAQKAIIIALKADPKNPMNLETAKFINEEIKKFDIAQKYVEIANYLDKPEKIQKLLQTIPANLQDDAMIMWLRNRYCPPMQWEKGTIAIYCGVTAEAWDGNSLSKGGLGGSETAVIELSKRLVKMGWSVTVFNDCLASPEGKMIDGVNYQNYWKFNIHDEFDVLWVWRLPELFDYKVKARLAILDLHDTMSPVDFTKDRLSRMDKIFVKTNFHRSLYPAIPDDKFVIVGNGIALSKFENTIEPRDPYRFIYASAPNRGLDVLLEMWPKIKAQVKQATLHIFYGWQTFYEIEKNNPERMMWMKKMQEMIKQDGVIDHGRVDQKTLAMEELKSSFWLYPTYFPEIDCITAKEMQAAGVMPITTGYGALEESQISGIKLPGDVYDPEWQEKYIKEVVEQINKPRETVSVQQFAWDRVAEVWNMELQENGVDNAEVEGVEFKKVS